MYGEHTAEIRLTHAESTAHIRPKIDSNFDYYSAILIIRLFHAGQDFSGMSAPRNGHMSAVSQPYIHRMPAVHQQYLRRMPTIPYLPIYCFSSQGLISLELAQMCGIWHDETFLSLNRCYWFLLACKKDIHRPRPSFLGRMSNQLLANEDAHFVMTIPPSKLRRTSCFFVPCSRVHTLRIIVFLWCSRNRTDFQI